MWEVSGRKQYDGFWFANVCNVEIGYSYYFQVFNTDSGLACNRLSLGGREMYLGSPECICVDGILLLFYDRLPGVFAGIHRSDGHRSLSAPANRASALSALSGCNSTATVPNRAVPMYIAADLLLAYGIPSTLP